MATWKERVIALRVERKESRAELASVIGVASSAVGRWERGESTPQFTQQKVIEALEREHASV